MEKFAKVRSVSEKATNRSSLPEVFLRKGVLKISSKFTGEYSCRIAISIKLLCNCIEMTLRYGCSPVNLLHIFRIPFNMNTSGWLLNFVTFNGFLLRFLISYFNSLNFCSLFSQLFIFSHLQQTLL